jgi:hypothetical protein
MGLLLDGGVYRRRADGSLLHDGQRPGPGWHAHGYQRRLLAALANGARVVLFKRRWKRVAAGTPRTCHSRPPDDLASVWFSAAVVLLKLWAWLDGDAGLHAYEEPPAVQRLGGSRRTVQRWMRRALPLASETLQAVRRAVMERSEPRPMEQLFPGGLPPPESLRRRRAWAQPSPASILRQACTLVVVGALGLNVSAPVLLAEARGRQATPTKLLI